MPGGRSRGWVRVFGIASLAAVGAGGAAVSLSGGGMGGGARNGAAWVAGVAHCWLCLRLRPDALLAGLLGLTPLALGGSLLATGQEGVHRWIRMGPLHWNVALLLLPAATVATGVLAEGGRRWAMWAALAIQASLWAQPDASQATAFAAAMVVALRGARWAGLLFVAGAALTWMRPDPLAPVPEVEGIVALAGSVSWLLGATCVLALGTACAAPLGEGRRAGAALTAYFAGCALAPLVGAFPVPLAGMGMSPVIGFWLGVGALLAARRAGSEGSPG